MQLLFDPIRRSSRHAGARPPLGLVIALVLATGCVADDDAGVSTSTGLAAIGTGMPQSSGATSPSAAAGDDTLGPADGSGEGGSACSGLGDPCQSADACCSHRCAGGFCVEPGACEPPGTACESDAECCSARCQPVLGEIDMVACTNYCFGDGAPCDKALDCCSLSCNDGTCGGEICRVESDDCEVSAQCCSNICNDEGRCEVDLGPGCRPIGEDCTSGGPTECCSGNCNEETDRCDFGDDVCSTLGAPCQADDDCCFGTCDPASGACVPQCVAEGDACQAGGDCCSTTCEAGGCMPPEDGCTSTGVSCSTSADCCTGLCLGGFCTDPVP